MASAALHGLLLLLLLWAPVRERLFEPVKEPVHNVSEERIRKVSAEMIRLQKEEAEKKLRELAEIRERIAEINRERLDQLADFQQMNLANAPDRALKLQEQAAASQENLMEKLEEIAPQNRPATSEEHQRLCDAKTTAEIEIQRQQEEAQKLLESAGLPQAAQAQAEAARNGREAVSKVNPFQEEIRRAMEINNQFRQRQESLNKAQSSSDQARQNLESATRALEQLQAQADLRQRLQSGQADENDKAQPAPPADINNRLHRQRDAARQQQARFDKAAKDLARANGELQNTAQQVEELKKHGKETSTRTAREAMAKAAESQRQAIQVLKKEMASRPTQAQAVVQTAVPPLPPAESKKLQNPESIPEAMEQAGAIESDILEQTRYSRAMKEAALRRVDLEQVLKSTSIAAPNRPELDLSPLERPASTTEHIEKQRAALREANARLASVTSQAREHLAAMQPQEGGTSVSLETLSTEVSRHEQLRQLASENSFERARDLVSTLAPERRSSNGKGSSGATAANHNPVNIQRVPTPVSQTPAQALPGRLILTSNKPGADRVPAAPWVYVNSWYVIGPFPNPRRSNIDRRFPPEFVLDLDAKYPGVDGKMVGWEFVKSNRLSIRPPKDREYSIFYAYTELWFDEDIDLWVAIGSDDNSRIWVNDEIVWISSYELKGWRFDEGFRRIPFRKGRNRILYRIENGHIVTDFSFALYLGQKPNPDPS
jgi:hypothetical protein